MAPTAEQMTQHLMTLFPGLLGVEIVTVTPDRIVGRMLVRAELATVGATLHGGAYMAFADTLGAIATVVNLPPGARTTTLESKTNFIGAAPVGTTVIGETTAFHKGRTTHVWQTQIKSEAGKLLAVVTQTQMILPAANERKTT